MNVWKINESLINYLFHLKIELISKLSMNIAFHYPW